MVQSKATTVDDYLDELPEERRAVIAKVRDVIRKNLPKGYEERVDYGMISYDIPLSRYPDTYNKKPLSYVGLAAQKNHYAVYLLGTYGSKEEEAQLRQAFEKIGKKPDIGKSCVRFKKLEDIPLDEIGKLIKGVPVDEYIRRYEKARGK
jgi:uncharacterized protein YdhG (YjbR/CyaY superfamily)